MHNSVTEESIKRANALFWEQMMAMDLVPVGKSAVDDSLLRCLAAEHVVGSCELSGVWTGRVEIRLSPSLAREATATMLMQAHESIQADDLLDAAKEIANMIAGTLKSALPRPCAMSVPSAEVVPNESCFVARNQDSVAVFFRHAAGEFMVRVSEE